MASSTLLFVACESTPRISTQTAPGANLGQYQTYNFMDKLGTDTAGYTSITTQWLKDAVSHELEARGLRRDDNPQLQVNLLAASKDKVQGDPDPRVAVSVGHGSWGHHGGGWGGGVGVGIGTGRDVETVTYDTLTVDLIDKAQNKLVWSASGEYRPTTKSRADGATTVRTTVAKLFTKYPAAVVAAR
jgi:hypothetical protein